jgi:diguanylate cyclase (GGDEF)-like protein
LERLATLAAAALRASESMQRTANGRLGPFSHARRHSACDPFRPEALDPVTGLPDATYLDAVLTRALTGSQLAPVALLVIEPDGLVGVRVRLGEVYADAAMAMTARAVVRTLRATDPVVRLDANRLAVVLPGARPHDAQRVAFALRRAIAEAGQTSSTPQPLTARIGLAVAPRDGTTALALRTAALRDISAPTPRHPRRGR